VRDTALALYGFAAGYARKRGIIIADTKFEFGLDAGVLTLIDEVLTPDSSRFWPTDTYRRRARARRASTSSSCATILRP
jgi:phosphoribosylaminoimidazole-succinocarboxamide synthase